MKRFSSLVVFLSLCSPLAFARPVAVILDVPQAVVMHHTATLLFGLKYQDGEIIGSGLFSDADIKAGVMQKTIQVDDAQTIASCSYEWALSGSSLNGVDSQYGAILLPEGFDSPIQGACDVDLTKGEIRLGLGSYQIENLVLSIPADSLIHRDADFVLASVAATSGSAQFATISVQANASTPLPLSETHYFLAPGPLTYNVSTFWQLKSGESKQETASGTDTLIEIK